MTITNHTKTTIQTMELLVSTAEGDTGPQKNFSDLPTKCDGYGFFRWLQFFARVGKDSSSRTQF